ncbi:hypothetical protein LY28_03773 [Ruminiclostridium sufflavum DSM 19573]|uniref:Uncharacterized protein n=1 Tax=Ruminiclostridium sufflavum DSM 19573 TaxID=1121337 RepID=A0A318XIC7_9FIRM|nr:hypothetical protein LY28_03773 [Ruminiclostridium sufflavum DSM 19573]
MFNQESYSLWKQRINEQRISGMTISECLETLKRIYFHIVLLA